MEDLGGDRSEDESLHGAEPAGADYQLQHPFRDAGLKVRAVRDEPVEAAQVERLLTVALDDVLRETSEPDQCDRDRGHRREPGNERNRR